MLDPTTCGIRGAASCWIQQLGCLRQCQCYVFYRPLPQGGSPPVELDNKILDPTTCSTPGATSCWIQQFAYPSKLLDSTLTYLYDVDVLKRITSVLAEKREPGDRNLFHTALRGIEEELHVPECELNKPDRARFLEDTYRPGQN